MNKYLIIKGTLGVQNNMHGIIYPVESIIGIVKAENKSIAKAKAIELTGIARPLVVIYSSLTNQELKFAETATILWTQPSGNRDITTRQSSTL